jgi:hypothetical protein
MHVLFIASVGIVVRDPLPNRALFKDRLGLPLQRHESDEYFFSERIEGSKHFGLWPLSQAAEACFGTTERPSSRSVPQLSTARGTADSYKSSSVTGLRQQHRWHSARHRVAVVERYRVDLGERRDDRSAQRAVGRKLLRECHRRRSWRFVHAHPAAA